MHEMSIALDVCRITEERAGALGGAGNVVTVAIEVGDDAGIEVNNLEFWLETLLKEPPFRKARPRIERKPGDVLRVAYLEVEDDDSND